MAHLVQSSVSAARESDISSRRCLGSAEYHGDTRARNCLDLRARRKDRIGSHRSKKYLQNYFEILFGEEEGRANPAKSVAKLLKYAFQESKLEKKSEFIHHAFGASESQVREAKRFFAGSAIPSYSQTIHALEVAIEMDEDDRKAWRWFVIIAQLIGRSSRRLEQLKTPIPNGQQPHAIYYEAMRTLLRERPASAMPSD